MRCVTFSDPRGGPAATLSRLGLGCSRIGSFGNPVPDRDVLATLDLAVDLGVTIFDTANIYGQGDSERALGDLARSRAERLFIVTKYGGRFGAKMRLIRPLKPLLRPLAQRMRLSEKVVQQRNNSLSVDFSPAHLRVSLDGSRRRLRTDRLDALLMHGPAAAVLADSAVTGALQEVREKGLARHVGVSVDDTTALEAAVAIPWVTIVQATLEVLDDPRGASAAATLRRRGGVVLAREVISRSRAFDPADAVHHAATRSDVDVVLVRTSRAAHLRELARAMG